MKNMNNKSGNESLEVDAIRESNIEVFKNVNLAPRRIFWLFSLLVLVIMTLLSINTGINEDDYYQNEYADKILSFYTSFGADETALTNSKGAPI